MKFVSIKDYIRLYFAGDDKPSVRTVRYWCENGIVPGRKIGGKWWIDLTLQATGNPLVDKVLMS